MSVHIHQPVHFDLGVDDLVSRADIAALAGSGMVGGQPATRARAFEAIPALPNLGPWAAALELPGLDCSSLHH